MHTSLAPWEESVKTPQEEARLFLEAALPQQLPKDVHLVVWVRQTKATIRCRSIEQVLAALKNNEHQDVYIGNLVNSAAKGRGKADEVDYLIGFKVDADYNDGIHKDTAHLPPSAEEAARLLTEAAPLPFSSLIYTGGGVQAWWFFDALVDVREPDLRNYVARLAVRFEDLVKSRYAYKLDSVANLDRVFRLPGSVNHKSSEPRPVETLELNAQLRYTLADFEELLGEDEDLSPAPSVMTTADEERAPLEDPSDEGHCSVPLDRIRELLRYIPKRGDYNDHWLKVLMCLHHGYGPKIATMLAEEWSPGYPGEVAEKMVTFGRRQGRQFTMRTFFQMAAVNGAPIIENNLIANRTINKRYLEASDIPTDARLVVIKSPRGTGKTEAVSAYLQGEPKLHIYGHRRALLRHLSTRFKTAYYLDESPGDRAAIGRIATCANSLASLVTEPLTPTQRPDYLTPQQHVIAIDEAEQLASHWSHAKWEGNRLLAWQYFLHSLRRARQVILMDADMTQETVDFFRELLSLDQEDIHVVTNTWSELSLAATVYKDKARLLETMLAAIKEGQRVFVPSNSARFLRSLATKIERDMPEVRLLCVTQDNSQTAEVQGILASPGCRKIADYQVVLASPSIGTGISIDVHHFDAVYGFGFHNVTPAMDFVQQLRRVRTVLGERMHLYLQSRYTLNQVVETAEDARRWMLHKQRFYQFRMNDDLTDFLAADQAYIKLASRTLARDSRSMHNFAQHAIQLLREEGISIELDELKGDAGVLQELREIRAQEQETAIQAIVAAPLISDDDANELRRKNHLEPEERASLRKHSVQEFYGQAPDELVRADMEGGLRTQLQQFMDLFEDPDVLQDRDARERRYELTPHMQLRHDKQALRWEILRLVNVAPEFEGAPDVAAWSEWLQVPENRDRLRAVLGIRVYARQEKRALGDVFRQLGLQWKTKQRKVNGKVVHEVLGIDEETVSYMSQLAETRRAALKEQQRVGVYHTPGGGVTWEQAAEPST